MQILQKFPPLQYLIFFLFCQCSSSLDQVQNISWEGGIIRYRDGKSLSEVKLKIKKDTFFVFSNVIFGSDRDTLLISEFSEKDSMITLINSHGDQLELKMETDSKDPRKIYFSGDDFYMVCNQSEKDLFAERELQYYHNRQVPFQAWKYLYGIYEGEIQSDNEAYNLVAMFSFGSVKTRLVFLDQYKVKLTGSAIFGMLNSKEILNYHIDGDNLIVECKSPMIFRMSERGYMLSMIKGNAELILHKQN